MESVALLPTVSWDPQVIFLMGLIHPSAIPKIVTNTALATAATSWSHLYTTLAKPKEWGREMIFNLWVAQYLFLWPSSLCAAFWQEVPCPVPLLSTTQDCLERTTVLAASRTHHFESLHFLDCKREGIHQWQGQVYLNVLQHVLRFQANKTWPTIIMETQCSKSFGALHKPDKFHVLCTEKLQKYIKLFVMTSVVRFGCSWWIEEQLSFS